ncbi:hypothetical protein ACFQVC_32460 [Streptomyces monticola]|uniref:Gram-positive cocci surface proteins LPxTG domain-containing protein n=1 Tax=Streptomyces monticola TaxID=2666263 RepID=A0ABW2JT12_9ACTN
MAKHTLNRKRVARAASVVAGIGIVSGVFGNTAAFAADEDSVAPATSETSVTAPETAGQDETPATSDQAQNPAPAIDQGTQTPATSDEGVKEPATSEQGQGGQGQKPETPATGNEGTRTPATGNQGTKTPETKTPETKTSETKTPATGTEGTKTPATGTEGTKTPQPAKDEAKTPATGKQEPKPQDPHIVGNPHRDDFTKAKDQYDKDLAKAQGEKREKAEKDYDKALKDLGNQRDWNAKKGAEFDKQVKDAEAKKHDLEGTEKGLKSDLTEKEATYKKQQGLADKASRDYMRWLADPHSKKEDGPYLKAAAELARDTARTAKSDRDQAKSAHDKVMNQLEALAARIKTSGELRDVHQRAVNDLLDQMKGKVRDHNETIKGWKEQDEKLWKQFVDVVVKGKLADETDLRIDPVHPKDPGTIIDDHNPIVDPAIDPVRPIPDPGTIIDDHNPIVDPGTGEIPEPGLIDWHPGIDTPEIPEPGLIGWHHNGGDDESNIGVDPIHPTPEIPEPGLIGWHHNGGDDESNIGVDPIHPTPEVPEPGLIGWHHNDGGSNIGIDPVVPGTGDHDAHGQGMITAGHDRQVTGSEHTQGAKESKSAKAAEQKATGKSLAHTGAADLTGLGLGAVGLIGAGGVLVATLRRRSGAQA